MKRHTLKEYIRYYRDTGKDVNYIQLVFGVHLINIDLSASGSAKLIRLFENEKFEKVDFINSGLLILNN